ncbi:MAG: ice-binding family protein [Prolixibacteraceae bacterium]
MKKLLVGLTLASAVLFAACEKDTYEAKVGVCPLVVSTIPLDKAVDVPLNQIVSATFNEKMNPETITKSSYTVVQGTTPVNGTVSYSGLVASFAPETPLAPFTTFTGRVKTSAKDLMGNAIQTDYVWTFTTVPQINLSSNPLAGGTNAGAGTFNQGSTVTVIATPGAGYSFVNWTENGIVVSTNSSYEYVLDGNRNLVANYTLQFVVSATSIPALGGTTTGSGSFASGTSVTVTATPAPGYSFVNWTENGTIKSTDASYLFPLSASRNLVANFEAIAFSLNVTALNGTVLKVPNTATYNSGASVVLTATPNSGYVFTSWSGDATGSANPLTVTMNAAKNITANFTLSSGFALNVTALNGTVLKVPNTATYNSGAAVILTATPNTGYVFSSWSGDATGSANPLTVTMNAAKNITANFIPISGFALNVIANNGSVLKNPNLVTYTSGASVILTATPNSGFKFDSWSGDASGSVSPLTVTMNANKNITANFIADIIPPVGPLAVNLGSAGNFAILAGSGISNTGVTTHIIGDVGSFPSATINGLLAGNVDGILYTSADPLVDQAKLDLTSAYNDAQSRSLNAISLPGQLGGLTLAPGLYVNSSTSGISGTGPNGILTLDAQGDANAVWIFKMGSTLVTDAGTSIVLAGGAQAKNIFWSVGTSATLGTNSIFYGNILADQAITLTTGATLYGRALTRIAAVTLDSSTITKP